MDQNLTIILGVCSAQWYRQVSPQSWTSDQVLEWISDHVDSSQFDASTLSLAYCTMDGATLCHLNQDHMSGLFGPQLGPQLYHNLQDHKTKYGNPVSALRANPM